MIATEAGHFYLPDGTPFYAVPNKSRPGEMRPATVRDARKAGAEPSVSTVLKAAAAPGLVRWQVERALDSALTLPRLPDESLDDFKVRALLDSQEQASQAREQGTALHGAIEHYLRGEIYNLQFEPHINAIKDALRETGIDLHEGRPERSFCVPGQYGGKVDWHSDLAVIDFKGCDDSRLAGGRMGYDAHIRQLAAYGHGLGLSQPRRLNLFIGRRDGAVMLREWTPVEAAKGLAEFFALLSFYRISNGFTEIRMTGGTSNA